ncbi:ABC transporter permease [Corynebacterium suranareeae]|uniref:ABC transporter permease n=1 Tax=Corynebacterium suranareeae TaxID=2506452 RepID=A0A160PRW7_9CORY|nr:ABC transporter permease [Corynebacterium suranareeae]BAU96345.1 ABC transporter permease [Corynebacterium suranareeae]
MFQGLKELTAAKGRTLLITVTVGLIAVLVTFLSALTAGLGHQSVSALKDLAGDRDLILADSGSTTLSASTLSDTAVAELDAEGADMLWQVRDRVGDTPVMLLNSPELSPGEISLPAEMDPTAATTQFHATSIVDTANDLYLDHLPVVLMNTSDLSHLAQIRGVQGPAGAFLDSSDSTDSSDPEALPADTIALSGSDRWNASASYEGEQMSLNLMVIMLYVISALVLGAFFTVWTIQRLRGIAISSALGAARRVLIADALGQAVIVLAIGIIVGTSITILSALGMGDAMPVVIDSSTTLLPALILAAAGLIGAAISLAPILRVEPRSALMTA